MNSEFINYDEKHIVSGEKVKYGHSRISLNTGMEGFLIYLSH